LDTDHISLHQRENLVILQRLSAIDQNNIAVTMITAEEQMRGWLNRIRQAEQPEKVVELW
jgi:tRNA(fMet)-specific endonuclease VapC